jgi:hypothetical protein
MSLEKAMFDLRQKQWQAKFEMIQESNRLQRELTQHLTQEQLNLREMTEKQIKVQMDLMDTEHRKCDSQIMFTDVSKLNCPLCEWVLRQQMEILAQDGINSTIGSEGPEGELTPARL